MVDVHIKTTDGGVEWNADSYSISETGILSVISGGDTIQYSPSYWQAVCVDPESDDPLGLRD